MPKKKLLLSDKMYNAWIRWSRGKREHIDLCLFNSAYRLGYLQRDRELRRDCKRSLHELWHKCKKGGD